MTVRLLFASFPLWSLGLLTWVPSLRFAILRRRPLDWAVFGASVLLTVIYVVLLTTVGSDPKGEEGAAAAWAGLYICLLITGGVVHAILADRFPRPARPAPAAPPQREAGAYGYPPAAPTPVHPPVHPQAHPPAQPQAAAPAPPASSRMRRVASELDELDSLLRERGNDR